MKIIKIECWKIDIKLKEPYTIAYGTFENVQNVFIRLETSTGISGYGIAAPDNHVTGEKIETVMKVLKDKISEQIEGCDPFRASFIIERLKNNYSMYPSVLAAVDMALFDILGKQAGLPVYKLLGGYRTSIKTSVTIGITDVNKTLKKAEGYINQGFKIIKLKGGINVDEDIEKVLKVRDKSGDKISIRFDANQGYSIEDSLKFVEHTRNARLEVFEQPTPRGKPDLLGRVTNAVHVNVMADESLINLRDAFRMARRSLMDMVNIKLMKTGGILGAQHVNSVARAAGMKAMIGCMDESSCGIAASLHFALARPNIVYADLDSHFDMLNDPCSNIVILKDGSLFPSPDPGFGISDRLF